MFLLLLVNGQGQRIMFWYEMQRNHQKIKMTVFPSWWCFFPSYIINSESWRKFLSKWKVAVFSATGVYRYTFAYSNYSVNIYSSTPILGLLWTIASPIFSLYCGWRFILGIHFLYYSGQTVYICTVNNIYIYTGLLLFLHFLELDECAAVLGASTSAWLGLKESAAGA